LRYLSERTDVDASRIGIAGFSYGGAVTLHSAAAWTQATHAKNADLRFAAHAPFYPSCGLFTAFAQGKRKTPGIPADALTKWTGAPVKIFAGGRDDYDDRDPNACAELVAALPPAYQGLFTIQLYPEATHAWDQSSASFYDARACKGRGCVNSNESNPEVTRKSIADLLDFFGKTLAAQP
jgi:dienelactone hydrolase